MVSEKDMWLILVEWKDKVQDGRSVFVDFECGII